jgi:hypothetical protein
MYACNSYSVWNKRFANYFIAAYKEWMTTKLNHGQTNRYKKEK